MTHWVVLLGPPGAGKGTQADGLVRRFALRHVSTGDALRAAIAAGTPLGSRVRAIVESGALVSDDVVSGVIEERLAGVPSDLGVLFDGYPRTLGQAGTLDAMACRRGVRASAVQLEVGAEEVALRLSARRTCATCGPRPPGGAAACDRCGGPLSRRADDTPEVMRERMEVHERQARPLAAHFEAGGRLTRIDGSGSAADVAKRLDAAMILLGVARRGAA